MKGVDAYSKYVRGVNIFYWIVDRKYPIGVQISYILPRPPCTGRLLISRKENIVKTGDI